ncbi:MAG: ubiquinone-dependent pyruvate dehydrogenase [Mucilaginibacter polytrichastri]|nr:ubiquinone-dependent pyruvate dehydrogenase [Mucilaginibacter polytrichastri]
MARTTSDQLVEMLVDAGVKHIYAVTGDSLNEVNDAVRRNGKIKWIHVRHEEAGAYAAGAEGLLNGLGCCAGSSGPGHVHLINGLYDAQRSSAPVLAIASTIMSSDYGSGSFQETNTIKLFDDCSYYNQLATTPEQLPRMLQFALQHAISKKGVSVLGLPGDLTKKEAVKSATADKIYPTNPVIRPSVDELNDLAGYLNKCNKITIFCGKGAEDAHPLVLELSARLKAPVGYSFIGKMAIQHHNPNEVGMTGLLGLPSAYHAMHEAELVLLLGTDFPYIAFIPDDKVILQIDTRPERLGRRAKLAQGFCGTIKDTLEALLPLLDNKTEDGFLKGQLALYEKVKERMKTYVEDKGGKDAIHPEYVAHEIDKAASDDAIFTVDTGMSCVWGARYINATGGRQMLGSFTHGSMANALAQAIGASLAQPGRQVIAFCGDGGLSMLLGDLATVRQYDLPIKIFVFNNRSLGMVKLEMQVAGLPDWQTDMHNPDFAMVAQAHGIPGLNVHDSGEVENAIRLALNTEGPYLVNLFTDPNALAMPPKVEFEQVKGMALSMTKLVLDGKMDEVLDLVKSNYKHIKDVF